MATSAPSQPPQQVEDEYAAFPIVEAADEYAAFPLVAKAEDDEYAAFPLVDAAPEVVAEEAQRATEGAKQALDVMAAPRAFDWSDANEQMDQERFREAEGLRAQGQPEQAAALLNEITPFTTAGQYVAQQRAGEAQGAAEAAATQARGGATPSEALRRGLGPGLSATVQPVVESGLRNVGAAAGGALAAAQFVPGPVGLTSRLATMLGPKVASFLVGATPIAGAVGGAIAGGSAQEALMQIGETPEETQRRQQLAAEAAARDPGLTKLGGALASGFFFGPSLAQFGRAAAGDVGAATNIALSGTIGAGVEVGGALLRGDTMSARDIAEAFALNAFLNEPTKLGRKLGLKPSSEQQAVEDATIKNEQPPIPIGPTSEVGVVAGMRQAPSAIPRKTAVAETPVVETPVAKPTETDAKISESLFPTDELALRGTEPVSGESVTRVRERKNDKGETVYVIEHGNGQVGYSDNPIWGFHSKFTETSTPAPETPATRTDEQRIAELVAAGMTPEEAAAGVARAKAAEVPLTPKNIEVAIDAETVDATEKLRDDFDPKRRTAMVFRFPDDKPQILYRGISERELKAIQANPDADIAGGMYSVPLERQYGAQYAATPEEAMRAAFHDERQKGVLGEKKYLIQVDARGKLASHLDPRATTNPELSSKMRYLIPADRVSGNLGVSVKVPFRDVLSVQEIVREGKGYSVKKDVASGLPDASISSNEPTIPRTEEPSGGETPGRVLPIVGRTTGLPQPTPTPAGISQQGSTAVESISGSSAGSALFPRALGTGASGEGGGITEPPTSVDASPPEGTSNKESVVNAERAQRALDPVIKEAAIENPEVVGYAEDVIAADPQRPQRIIDRLRAAPPEERTISLVDGGILLIERTKLRARRDAALARASRKEGSPMEQAIAQSEFDAAEGQLNAMDQAAQDARSTWGRFGQFWQRSMREDFSLANLERRARLSKDGPLTEKDIKGITAIAEKAKAAHEAFDIRQKQLELESRQSAIEAKIAEVSGKDIPAPIMQRFRDYMQRLSVAADFQAKKAEEALRAAFEKSQRLGAVPNAPDPILGHVIDLAFAKVVKGAADFGGWSAEMVSKWGARIEPYLQNAWAAATAKAESSVDRFTGDKKKRAAIKAAAKVPLNAAAQQARIEQAIGARIAEGKPLSSLAPYVNKLQESFIAQGITQREPLIDAVHGALQKHDPAITRDDAMEIMSKYGSDYATPLSKDPVKQTRRQVDGEIQQLLKLRDIAAKVPLPKSGPERPTPGPTWRNLIKQVNAAKKKLGVVVTDPETQLKSSQDAIRTRLRNDIEDMTLELETGERPPEKTPAEYTQDMEILKGVRDRVRETLRSIDENPQLTDEQRLALTKRSAEESLALWERRLAGETAKAPKQRITSPEIEAIRAKRDAIKAEVEELNAADAVLQENRKAEALVRQIEATEAQLASNAQRVKAQGADSQLVAEAREQLAAVRAALDTKRANDPLRQAEAIEKAEQALEASIKKLDADLQAGNIATRTKPTRLESDRLIYLRAQRDALNQLRAQLRAEARPRIAADQLAIKMRTTQMLKRAAELRRRIAAGDFGPRTRKAPVDISGDRAALDAQADLMSVDAEFQKLQEQWKLDQLTWPQQVLRRAGQAWDASANIFLSFDLSTPLQTAFAMAAHPVTGAKAVGKGAKAFYEQFIKSSDAYANREAARIANSTNAKNGLYKAMKLELPSALGKKREENMVNVLEQLADLDARWAGLPDVVKGLFKLEGKSLLRGGKRLASVIPKVAGSGIKASNSAFETIANTMRARTADAMLARWYSRGRGTPTKQQLELLGEQVNIATGKGGLRSGDSVRRLLFAPNYYLSIIKQLSGYQLGKAAVRLEGQVAKDIATEYVRAVATMGALYGLNALFGNEVEWDARSKEFGRPKTDRGTAIDLTMGRGAWITAGAQIATGERIQNGKIKDADRKGTALAFAGGRLSRGVATALTSAFGEDYKGKPIEGIEILKDFVIPLGWRNFDDVLRKEGFTRGSFIQLLNILGVTHNVHE